MIYTDFLLDTQAARQLYHSYAESMPILDYHCHLDPQAIVEDKQYRTITELWLGGDHYKWRLMRACGVPEELITGDGGDFEKFQAWAQTLPRCVGNPVYSWSYLELSRYFNYDGPLDGGTARMVYDHCNQALTEKGLSVRRLIQAYDVRFICTTDDPADNLAPHKRLAASDFPVRVLPAFRPDKAIAPEKAGFAAYVARLSQAAEVPITDYASLCLALQKRMDYFHDQGCRISDHALEEIPQGGADAAVLDAILQKGLGGQVVPPEGAEVFKATALAFLGREYAKRGWAMQLHYGCTRDNNTPHFNALGPDTGNDAVLRTPSTARALRAFLNGLAQEGALPKMILYPLDEGDYRVLSTLSGCFQGENIRSKIQVGSAWWFNDTRLGMVRQLTELADTGVLGNFVGMLTDARSFLSYARHEYFRRVLCGLLGRWYENGEWMGSLEEMGALAQDICYNNASRYFGLS